MLLFTHPVMTESLWPRGVQHARLPCPWPSHGVCSLMSIELVRPSKHLVLYHTLLLPSIFPSLRVFSSESLSASGGQTIGVSASVLPMNIQVWVPLGLTGLIFLQSKGLSRVFSNTTVQKHQFFSALAWKIPGLKSLKGYSPWGIKETGTTGHTCKHPLGWIYAI